MPVAATASVKPRVLLLVPFDVSALDREEQWVGEGVAQILSLGLAQHPAFVQVERVRLRAYGQPEAWGDAALGRAARAVRADAALRSEEHTSELQSLAYLVCRLLLEKKKEKQRNKMS